MGLQKTNLLQERQYYLKIVFLFPLSLLKQPSYGKILFISGNRYRIL